MMTMGDGGDFLIMGMMVIDKRLMIFKLLILIVIKMIMVNSDTDDKIIMTS